MSPADSQPPDRIEIVDRLRVAGCVFAEDEADVLLTTATDADQLLSMVDLRIRGVPLEHVVGWAEFCGIRVTVEPGVFIPRPRSELLVREAAAAARRQPAPVTVVDLCCGCGAVGAALAARVPDMSLHAADIDAAAVRCARANLAGLGAAVYTGDLFSPLPSGLRGRVAVVVANVPYVPTGEIALMPVEARQFEPRLALDGGADGLAVLRRVAAEAPGWLVAGGAVLMETSERQAVTAHAVLRRAGLIARTVHCPELEATVVIGQVGT